MKYQIKSRYNNSVIFECDIPEGMESRMMARHALEKAVEIKKDLGGAYLVGAYLVSANLVGANLVSANLVGANLRGANLRDAYLGGANLRDAYLGGANLRGANLRGAYLGDANLRDANLRGANLRDAYLGGANLGGANLRDAYLGGANLRGAYLGDANLNNVIGDKEYLKTMQIEDWSVAYTYDTLQIGCQKHLISEWKKWKTKGGKDWISEMDSNASDWAIKFLPIILKLIEISPAKVPEIKEKANGL